MNFFSHLKRIFYVIALACFICVTSITTQGSANAQTAEESELKSQWVEALIPYVSWPEKKTENIALCMLGRDRVFDYLEKLANQDQSLKLTIIRKSVKSSLDDCNIVYVGTSEREVVRDTLARMRNKNIISISSIADFAQEGGVIEFVTESNNVTLVVNASAAEREKITLDSDLLAFVKVIHTGQM